MFPYDLLAALACSPPVSVLALSDHAPVFKVDLGDRVVVLKRTSARYGEAVAQWSGALAARGVGIVAPLPAPAVFTDTPGGPARWSLYPFVAGRRYRGTARDLASAGALLGQVHAALPDHTFGLPEYPSVRPFSADDLAPLAAAALSALRAAQPDLANRAQRTLGARVARYLEDDLPSAQRAALAGVNCSWDHKAANLVFVDDAPVLIDPDNAARLPRVYDLALTALSFHLDPDLHGGPARLLTPQEWQTFLHGYARHVSLTDTERAVWPAVLRCAWMDEALWQLSESGPTWGDERHRRLWLDLWDAPAYALDTVM